ncbi:MAG: glutaredoxin 3 [Telmatospirillum sp.]|nr:glutaredoxin 3 [Telmatospirillum sp.]
MARVEIYTTTICPYCVRAKSLLKRKGAAYEEINIERDDSLRQTMMDRAGGRQTVPQIFIDGRHVGGCDDLYALDRNGELDRLLGLVS